MVRGPGGEHVSLAPMDLTPL